jgi:hypothetical protein
MGDSAMTPLCDKCEEEFMLFIRGGYLSQYIAECFICGTAPGALEMANREGHAVMAYASCYRCQICDHAYTFAEAPLPEWTNEEVRHENFYWLAITVAHYHHGFWGGTTDPGERAFYDRLGGFIATFDGHISLR